MSRIAIDARRIRSQTGRYVRELLNHLQEIDSTNSYDVVAHEKDRGAWEPTEPNFKIHYVDFDHYTLAEPLGFNSYLKKLDTDLVHFTMPQ